MEQILNMRTCKLLAEFRYLNIINDFDIFEVRRDASGKVHYIENRFLNGDFKAQSVYHSGRSSCCYILCNREENSSEEIRGDFDEYIVRKLDENEMQELPKHVILNLFINKLKMGNRGKHAYNNITGRLLRVVESRNDVVKTLRLNIDENMCLFPQVETYTKSNDAQIGKSKQVPFLFDPNTGVFRKKTAFDKSQDLYIKRSPSKKHKNTQPFFSYGSPESFFESKLGYMYRLLNDVSFYLKDYVTLRLSQYQNKDNFIHLKYENSLDYKHLSDRIAERGLNIVNMYLTEQDKSKADDLIKQIGDLYKHPLSVGDIDESKYNIILVHSPEFYKKGNIDDPYETDYGSCVTQHLIIDKNSIAEAQFKVILKELFIKQDVTGGRINITDWTSYGFGRDMNFAVRTVEEEMMEEESDNTKTVRKTVIYLMTVHTDGSFETRKFDPNDFFDNSGVPMDEQRAINSVFESEDWLTSDVEMVAYEDIDNIYIIKRTSEHTLPNLIEIGQRFETYKPSKSISTEILLKELETFTEHSLSLYETEHLKNFLTKKAKLTQCLTELCEGRSKVTAEEIWTSFKNESLHKHIGQVFNVHLLLNQSFCISPQIKSHYFEKLYSIENFIGIHCTKTTNAEKVPSYSYFVGEKKERDEINGGSVANGCVIRRIFRADKKEPEEAFVRKLLSLLQVNFVRLEQSSVLPFPVKYIRESM